MTTISLDCTYYYHLDYILKATSSGVPPSPTSHVHIVTSSLCLRNGQESSSRSGTNPRYRSYSKVIPRSTYLINYPKVALPPNYAPMMLSKHMETHHLGRIYTNSMYYTTAAHVAWHREHTPYLPLKITISLIWWTLQSPSAPPHYISSQYNSRTDSHNRSFPCFDAFILLST